MKYYYFKKKLYPYVEDECPKEGCLFVEVLSTQQYEKRFQGRFPLLMLRQSMDCVLYSKAEVTKESISGTIVLPDRKNLLGRGRGFGYYIDHRKLFFVDDHAVVVPILEAMCADQPMEELDLARFYFEFLEYMIRDDVFFLQEYEHKLAELEELVYFSAETGIHQKIMVCRRELMNLSAYYHQLMDMSSVLGENVYGMFSEEEARLFEIFADRAKRLYEHAQLLREYALQIRELYQGQMDVRQNKVMQFLTVVTTVFLPLTLITGWYGMNFRFMPELNWEKGYLFVICVSLLILAAELWYFKRKQWF